MTKRKRPGERERSKATCASPISSFSSSFERKFSSRERERERRLVTRQPLWHMPFMYRAVFYHEVLELLLETTQPAWLAFEEKVVTGMAKPNQAVIFTQNA